MVVLVDTSMLVAFGTSSSEESSTFCSDLASLSHLVPTFIFNKC